MEFVDAVLIVEIWEEVARLRDKNKDLRAGLLKVRGIVKDLRRERDRLRLTIWKRGQANVGRDHQLQCAIAETAERHRRWNEEARSRDD